MIRIFAIVPMLLLALGCGTDSGESADNSPSAEAESGDGSGGTLATEVPALSAPAADLECVGVQWALDGHETVTASNPQDAASMFAEGLDGDLQSVVSEWSDNPTRVSIDWKSKVLDISSFPENMPDSQDSYELSWQETDSGYEFEFIGSNTREESAVGWRLSTLASSSEYGPLSVLASLDPSGVAWSDVSSSGPGTTWPPAEAGVQSFSDNNGKGVVVADWNDFDTVNGQVFVCLEK